MTAWLLEVRRMGAWSPRHVYLAESDALIGLDVARDELGAPNARLATVTVTPEIRPMIPETETRAEAIARWEARGDLDPACHICRREWYASDEMPQDVFAPRHKASDNCQSGQRPHCTCDTCF